MEAKITIVVVGYNRPDSMHRVLKSLAKAHYSYSSVRLVISIDHGNVNEVVDIAKAFEWSFGEKIVISHPKRLGLRAHILSCGDLTKKYGAVMILEDDLYVSPDYYDYAMTMLEKYGEHPRIAGISLNTKRELLESVYPFFPVHGGYDIYFQQFATSWGQVWNVRMWNEFREWLDAHPELPWHKDVPEVVLNYPKTSWAKFYQTFVVDKDKYFVYSYDSLTTNFGDAGQHFGGASSSFQSVLFYGKKDYRMPEFETGIKYDIYGEMVGLGKYMGIQEQEFTCDLWGRKRKEAYRRYVLSTRRLPYKIIKSYGMQLKPMELNVIEGIKGKEIRLYDTNTQTQTEKERRKKEHIQLLEYGYGILDGRDLLSWGMERLKRKLWKRKL